MELEGVTYVEAGKPMRENEWVKVNWLWVGTKWQSMFEKEDD